MIILRHGKFISDGRIYTPGEIVPDTEVTRFLIEKGYAEVINNKPAKKRPEKAEIPRENDKSDT